MAERRRSSAWRASRSATAACARWRRPSCRSTPGRIHAILGENGAGKSTLIKVMAGVVAPDEGRMTLEGREVTFASPAAANAAGIACIFQELSLIPDLSVADNIVISDPPTRFGMIDRRAQRADRRGGAGARRRRRHPSAGAGQGPAAVAPADGRDRQGAGAQAAHPDPRRGDLGADRGRRRQGLRRAEAAARRRAWRCSTSRTACTRSPSSPTNARCSATAATSRPTRPAPRPTTKSSR